LKHVLVAGQTVDVAIPKTKHGYEPLCASYGQGCLPKMMQQITRGRFKLHDLLPYLKIREIGPGEIAAHDKDGNLFFNVNTPDDYRWALEQFKDR
jgi:molybdopterin-guanine dinucleotide biosynthesis protein A